MNEQILTIDNPTRTNNIGILLDDLSQTYSHFNNWFEKLLYWIAKEFEIKLLGLAENILSIN